MGKQVRDTRVMETRVLRNVFSKHFCFTKCKKKQKKNLLNKDEQQISCVENNICNKAKASTLFCVISKWKLAASRTLLQQLLA